MQQITDEADGTSTADTPVGGRDSGGGWAGGDGGAAGLAMTPEEHAAMELETALEQSR